VPPRPRVSIVIPVHGVEEYLGGCLDSILSQPGDIEVIAVDDASPDGCGTILDARAGLDPRLRVVHLAENAGPGHARNVGLSQADGDYVWFVDADDLLTDGAVAAITARLELDHPDVLLIDYEDLYPDGSAVPSRGHALLRDMPGGSLTLAERPQLIHLTMTAWSKVIRRAFLSGLVMPFPQGVHEDVPVACAMLFSAERISGLARVCYRYRRARPGSFMATTSSAHLRIFSSYEAALGFAALADPPLTSEVRAAVFQRAIWHYTTVLQAAGPGIGGLRPGRAGRGGLVPHGARREFFERMHEHFLRYRPPGYRHPPGIRGVKFRLVERNAYWMYSVLEPVNQMRVLLTQAASRRPDRGARVTRVPGSHGLRKK
jgi:CDP-glycerol glycerophosphotransferase